MVDPQTPDEFEQRQGLDGSLEEDPVDAAGDDVLDPDEFEQRQVVPDDDREEHP